MKRLIIPEDLKAPDLFREPDIGKILLTEQEYDARSGGRARVGQMCMRGIRARFLRFRALADICNHREDWLLEL